jgi:predicted unusual protein kinase regulating ubiquinone biosynthesis (AarF/ABC1/UbiB family)
MRDDVRPEVARRLAAAHASLPTTWVGRPARLVGGLARAGAGSLRRGLRNRFFHPREDVEPEATVAATLGRLKGVPMKLGQVLGYIDVGLSAPMRAALSALHTQAQPLDVEGIGALLDRELGDPGVELARTLEPEPLSVASVGQVHRATLSDGTMVAVKVLHPHLARVISRDLAPAMATGRIASFVSRRSGYRQFVTDVRARLLEECDYTLEALRQERFAALFAGHPTLVVPAVHARLSSPRILTTTFVAGLHLDDWLASQPSQESRDRAGRALFDLYIGSLFRHGFYNCDPHPGNYLFLPDGRVAVVDFGSTAELGPGFGGRLASLLEALRADDGERLHGALVELGAVADKRRYDRDATRWLLRAFFGPLLVDEVSAFDVAAGVRFFPVLRRWWSARALSVSPELPFLLRTFIGLSSVLARLGARANWSRQLEPQVAGAAAIAAPPMHTVHPPRPVPPIDRAVEDPGQWDLVLVDPGTSPIALVRELREVTGLDLAQVKYLMDASPRTIREAIPRDVAETLRARFQAAGAKVELRRSSVPPR